MLLEEMALYLTAHGIVDFREKTDGGNCFIFRQPQKPDNCVTIYPRPGLQSDSKIGYDFVGVQFIIRDREDGRWGFAKGCEIRDLLHGFRDARFVDDIPQTAFLSGNFPALHALQPGTWIASCLCREGQPANIGYDNNNRAEFSLNFILEIRNLNRRD